MQSVRRNLRASARWPLVQWRDTLRQGVKLLGSGDNFRRARTLL